MKKKAALLLTLLLMPAVAFAVDDAFELIAFLLKILYKLIQIVLIFIVVAFGWGIGIFILNSQDTKKLEEAKKWMFWAIIAFFVAMSLWGIMGFLIESLGADPLIIPPEGTVIFTT